jgi:hypothetical protein
MRLSRIVIAWMVLWLAASGALAAVMPYCQHALQPAPASAMAHAGHGMPSGPAHDDAVHESSAQSDDVQAALACDDCGTCHLVGSGMPAAPMALPVDEFESPSRSFVAADFRGHIPEQPYHPPKASRTA